MSFGESFTSMVKNLTRKTGISFLILFFLSLLSCVISSGWPRVIKLDAMSFYSDIQQSKFSFAPVGAAIDSHRTWESLMLGTIPIVFQTPLDPLFEGLPVVILRNVTDATPAYLKRIYPSLRTRTYEWEKLFGFYWILRIRDATDWTRRHMKYSYPPQSFASRAYTFLQSLLKTK